MRAKILQYSVSFAVASLMTFALSVAVGLFKAETALSVVKKLCDASLVTGALFSGVGILIMCSNKGAFDMIGYGLKTGLKMLIPGAAIREEKLSYDKYREKRAKKKTPYKFMVITGLIFLALSLGFTVAYLCLE